MAGSIGDLLFNVMGQPDPRQQLAAALAGNNAPQPAPNLPATLALPGMGGGASGPPNPVQLPGADPNTAPDPNAAPAPQTAAPAPQAAPPQPAAYSSTPDLTSLYMQLADRQQANESINRGFGLLAGAFAQPQDRAPMMAAMTGQVPDASATANNLIALQQNVFKMNQQRMMMAQLPTIAAQLKMPIEQVQAAYASGALDDILKAAYVSNTPLNHAQVQKAVADANESSSKAQQEQVNLQQKQALIASAPTLATQYGIPVDQVNSLIASGGWAGFVTEHQKAIDANQALTDSQKQYNAVAADNKARGLPVPSYSDWLGGGAGNPTAEQKNYKMAMSQLPPGAPQPSFDDWVAQQQGAKEAAGQTALLQTQAKIGAQNQLPDVAANITDQIRNADAILADPNLKNITGWHGSGIGNFFSTLPGSAGKDLQEKLDQLAGASGVSAVKSLVGVGRILGAEFSAGVDAQSRLHDQSQSPAAYVEAIRDYRNKIASQLRIIYGKAGAPIPGDVDALLGSSVTSSTRKVIRNSAGQLELQ